MDNKDPRYKLHLAADLMWDVVIANFEVLGRELSQRSIEMVISRYVTTLAPIERKRLKQTFDETFRFYGDNVFEDLGDVCDYLKEYVKGRESDQEVPNK